MRKVIVTVVGTQRGADGEECRIELVTVGSRQDKNGVGYITYRESEISGLEGTTTLLKIYPDRFTLIRMGAVEQKQEFALGVASRGVYLTPYGAMDMTVATRSLEMAATGGGQSLKAGYDLTINGEWQSYNTLTVDIREEAR